RTAAAHLRAAGTRFANGLMTISVKQKEKHMKRLILTTACSIPMALGSLAMAQTTPPPATETPAETAPGSTGGTQGTPSAGTNGTSATNGTAGTSGTPGTAGTPGSTAAPGTTPTPGT